MTYVDTFTNRRRFKEGQQIQEDAVEKIKRKLGPDHTYTLRAKCSYANTIRNVGKIKQARRWKKRSQRRAVLGPGHWLTPRSKSNYGHTLIQMNELGNALEVIQEVVQKRVEVLPPDHLGIPDARLLQGSVSIDLERFSEAEQIFKEVQEKSEGLVGLRDQLTVRTKLNLAAALKERNKLREAAKKYQEVVQIAKDSMEFLYMN